MISSTGKFKNFNFTHTNKNTLSESLKRMCKSGAFWGQKFRTLENWMEKCFTLPFLPSHLLIWSWSICLQIFILDNFLANCCSGQYFANFANCPSRSIMYKICKFPIHTYPFCCYRSCIFGQHLSKLYQKSRSLANIAMCCSGKLFCKKSLRLFFCNFANLQKMSFRPTFLDIWFVGPTSFCANCCANFAKCHSRHHFCTIWQLLYNSLFQINFC